MANPAVASITVTDDGGVNLQLGTTRAIWAQEVDSSVVPLESPDGNEADEVLFEETVSYITRSSVAPNSVIIVGDLRSTASWRRSRSTEGASTAITATRRYRRGVPLVAQLIITATLAIIPPVNATPKVRASIQSLLREIAPGLHQVLHRAVGRIRQSGPRPNREDGKQSSCPSPPASGAGRCQCAELRLARCFIRAFTNEVNASRGWFDQLEKDVERALVVLGNLYVSRLAAIYADQIFQQLVRVAARRRGHGKSAPHAWRLHIILK